jgi:predicted PurR-regulated permease PerM
MVLKKLKKFASEAIKKYSANIQEKELKAVLPKKQEVLEQREITLNLPSITKSLLIFIGLGIMLYLIIYLREILILFLISYLFAASIAKFVDKLEHKRISRPITVAGIIILFFLAISLFFGNFIPILATEITELGIQFQSYLSRIQAGEINLPSMLQFLEPLIENTAETINANSSGDIQNALLTYGNNLGQIANNAIALFASVSNGLANFLVVLFLTFFIAVDQKTVDEFLISLFPKKYKNYLEIKFSNIKSKVADWLTGQLLLMLAVGVITYIGLLAIGIDYAFTLSLLAGLTELIPVVGPLVAWVAAIPIAANSSGAMIFWVTIVYFLVQRLENSLLVPFIMKKTTGLHPILVIFSVMAGFKFLGIVGVIISVPIMTIIAIFFNDYQPKS